MRLFVLNVDKNELGPYFFKEYKKKKKVSPNFALREVPKKCYYTAETVS